MEFKLKSDTCRIDCEHPIDISIPLQFNGNQPNFFAVPKASSRAYKGNGFIGDTRRGGSCNVREYSVIAHCNGTHTECVGHIVNQKISVLGILQEVIFPATLITVNPEKATISTDSYVPEKGNEDFVITRREIEKAVADSNEDFLKGLIIRTLPNDSSKMSRDYNQYPAPFFSIEAMECILRLGVKHLLVDIPSVDRANDEGKMTCHHLFWEMEAGSKDIDDSASQKTITEMVYLPDSIMDGNYFVNIQIPPFVSDAAPSRPVLFKI